MTETFKHRIETQYKINERFYTQDITNFGTDRTWKMYTRQFAPKL